MSNKTDLDWLARNVHVWPAGDHQPWCYVYMVAGGAMKASGNFLDAVAYPTMVTKDQWLARRAELQNKPSWSKAEEWAEWLAQDSYGCWGFFQKKPLMHALSWIARSGYYQIHSQGNLLLGDWRDTLEKRPEEFKPFTSIEDNQDQVLTQQQDNGWFERGELPPVGTECEIDLGAKWRKAFVVGRNYTGRIVVEVDTCDFIVADGCTFRPIRTERDVLIEIIKKTDDTDDRIADAILAAGFKRGAA